VVSRDDIRRYYETGELADELRDWPHQLGAPVIDGDGDSTNYNLRAGDQPDLIGDMAAWWVLNDLGNGQSSGQKALGVEVRVHAFVYGDVSQPINLALMQAAFVRYEIINRGDQVIEDAYVAIETDIDIGGANDDFMGADSLLDMGFFYDDSNDDRIYSAAPPAQGLQVLIGPVVGEDTLGMSGASTFLNGGPLGSDYPYRSEHYHNYMQGLWADGAPIYEFGDGYQEPGHPTTRFMFPGNPVNESFWSQVNSGESYSFNSRVLMVSTGPFDLDPGAGQTVWFAFPYARGASNLQSVAALQAMASALKRAAREGFLDSRPVERAPVQSAYELALSRVRPNPSVRQPEAVLTLPAEAHVHATVYDALGRQLGVVVDGELAEGETVLALPNELAPGTYVLRVRVDPGGEQTLSFTIAR